MLPSRFTSPLVDEWVSGFDRFEPVFRIVWEAAFGYWLEPWQVDLVRRVTELDDSGRLRYRQVLVSVGRQNGKTELAAALGLWGLLRKASSLVIGIASSAEQARLVYQRTMQAVRANPALAKRFDALTDTRGLRTKDGGRYELKAARGAALQGLPIDLGLVDEVHLLDMDLWTSLVNGTGGRDNSMVVGITTAGDQSSELLQHLYKLGDEAVGESGSSFGFFVWEASEANVPEDDAELGELLKEANPAIASGRVSLANVVDDCRSMPEVDVVRYRLNRFVSSHSSFIQLGDWMVLGRGEDEAWPDQAGRPVFAVDRTPDWGYAAIAVAVKDDDGVTHTELVASIVRPSLEQLVNVCVGLQQHSPAGFVMDGYTLKALHEELKRRGLPSRTSSLGDIVNGSALLFSKVKRQQLRHGNDPVVALQLPHVVRKNVGDNFRVSRQDSSVNIDAVMATLLAVHGAETATETGLQVF